MGTSKPPAAPRGSGPRARALWADVVADHILDQHEEALLVEACRTVDDLDACAEVVKRDGVMLGDRLHPAQVEARQLRLVLARLIASLRLPEGVEDARPQRRGSARGTYLSARRYGSA